MSSKARVSVIVPNRSGEETIEECLKAAFTSDFKNFEVVLVDDASTDNSLEIVSNYPVKLIELKEHAGVSAARNTGARNANGDVLLFIDADCILEPDALALVERSVSDETPIIGGTYTRIPFDSKNFFSTFQSIFINYSETRAAAPDYIAAHCLAIKREVFEKSKGFIEDSYIGVAAGVEDVEFCHRLKKAGYTLKMNPDILVRHIFNFNFSRSMKNAFKKSRIWTMYSLHNKDVLSDSGTASRGLKFNVVCCFSSIVFALFFIWGIPFMFTINVLLNLGLIEAFYRTKGLSFAIKASAYYFLVYPIAVGLGALAGAGKYIKDFKLKGRHK
ncbi:glycosyltransferase [archaeon]|nr:glycosyltransferase [archaeon]